MLFSLRKAGSPDDKASVYLRSSLVSVFAVALVLIPILMISILMTWSILKDLLA